MESDGIGTPGTTVTVRTGRPEDVVLALMVVLLADVLEGTVAVVEEVLVLGAMVEGAVVEELVLVE